MALPPPRWMRCRLSPAPQGSRTTRSARKASSAAEVKAARAAGARLLCHGDPNYPPDLMDIADAPPLLWVVGDPGALRRPMVALVGARNASSLGMRMARAMATGLGQAGFTVVSGLARGIDTAAHLASLGTGTVAVMAGGVDVLYPPENAKLAEDIVREAARVISEQPMGLQPLARHFPVRNRIVSGLSRGVVVVEAATKSGSLITARTALDQGREVLAVPGHPFDARAAGCNMLIRDGARLVRGAEDILEALPPGTPRQAALDLDRPGPARRVAAARSVPEPALPARPSDRRPLGETAALHSRSSPGSARRRWPKTSSSAISASPSGTVAPVLTDLELDGRIRRQPGGLLSLVP